MITADNLTVTFGGVTAIDDLSVELDGGVVGLIGPNGAGKTTLLNVLSGFVAPTEGRVLVDGVDQASLTPAARARTGLRRTFQTELVIDELTIWDNVLITAENTDRRNAAAHVAEVLETVGLHERTQDRVSSLDTFERRLVEIARAVVGRPAYVLMDEPGGGLGVAETERLAQLIVGLPDAGVRVVLVDHDVELILATCENTVCLDFGKLIATGPTAAVLESSEVRAAYLGVDEATSDSPAPAGALP